MTQPERSDSPGWTQPVCTCCWLAWSIATDPNQPLRAPVRVTGAEKDKCVVCGVVTESGIYVRIPPPRTLELLELERERERIGSIEATP